MQVRFKDLIKKKLIEGYTSYAVANFYDVKGATVSKHLNDKTDVPSLLLARKIYQLEGIVVYPYSEEGVHNE